MYEDLGKKMTCAILGFSFGVLFGLLWENLTLKIGHLAHQNGYHFHHSLFGVIAFIFIPIFWNDVNRVIFITGFGLGMIIQHVIKDGFVFITKD